MVPRTACNRWWVLMLRGTCAIALGISAIVWPRALAIVLPIGAYMIAIGVFAVALALRLRRMSQTLTTATG